MKTATATTITPVNYSAECARIIDAYNSTSSAQENELGELALIAKTLPKSLKQEGDIHKNFRDALKDAFIKNGQAGAAATLAGTRAKILLYLTHASPKGEFTGFESSHITGALAETNNKAKKVSFWTANNGAKPKGIKVGAVESAGKVVTLTDVIAFLTGNTETVIDALPHAVVINLHLLAGARIKAEKKTAKAV